MPQILPIHKANFRIGDVSGYNWEDFYSLTKQQQIELYVLNGSVNKSIGANVPGSFGPNSIELSGDGGSLELDINLPIEGELVGEGIFRGIASAGGAIQNLSVGIRCYDSNGFLLGERFFLRNNATAGDTLALNRGPISGFGLADDEFITGTSFIKPYITWSDIIGSYRIGTFIVTPLGFATGGGPEIGTIETYPITDIPENRLICDGSSLSTSSYSNLFDVIGYIYGGSGGSFNIPDLENEFIRGTVPGGRAVGSLQTDQFKSHRHGVSNSTADTTTVGGKLPYSHSGSAGGAWHTTFVGSSETRPRNVAMVFTIKYE